MNFFRETNTEDIEGYINSTFYNSLSGDSEGIDLRAEMKLLLYGVNTQGSQVRQPLLLSHQVLEFQGSPLGNQFYRQH